MGVADGVSRKRLLAADITNLCHGLLQMSSGVDVQTIDFNGVGAMSTTCDDRTRQTHFERKGRGDFAKFAEKT